MNQLICPKCNEPLCEPIVILIKAADQAPLHFHQACYDEGRQDDLADLVIHRWGTWKPRAIDTKDYDALNRFNKEFEP